MSSTMEYEVHGYRPLSIQKRASRGIHLQNIKACLLRRDPAFPAVSWSRLSHIASSSISRRAEEPVSLPAIRNKTHRSTHSLSSTPPFQPPPSLFTAPPPPPPPPLNPTGTPLAGLPTPTPFPLPMLAPTQAPSTPLHAHPPLSARCSAL